MSWDRDRAEARLALESALKALARADYFVAKRDSKLAASLLAAAPAQSSGKRIP
jgi:hypothetical protein